MKNNFSLQNVVADIGEDLIAAFDRAGRATHTVAVGSGREAAARKKLESVLPSGIGVGTGFVYDKQGNVSQQCDVVIYEKDFVLKYSHNEDESNTYYNCESVIAVGEIKSTASITEIKDALGKFVSLNKLKRINNDNTIFRKYLSSQSIQTILSDAYDPVTKELDQIYKFFLCKNFSTSLESIVIAQKEICKTRDNYGNIFISTDGSIFTYGKIKECNMFDMMHSAMKADFMNQLEEKFLNIGILIHELCFWIKEGRTVPWNINEYIYPNSCKFTTLKNVPLT